MIAVDQLTTHRPRIGESKYVRTRDDDLVELMHAFRAGMQPRAVVRLAEEGREGGELVRLEEGTQAAARVIDVSDAVRTNSAGAFVVALTNRTSTDAPVAICAPNHDVACVAVRERESDIAVISDPLCLGRRRHRRVARDQKHAERLRAFAWVAHEQPHRDHARADSPHVRARSAPRGGGGAGQHDGDALRAAARLHGERCADEGEAHLFEQFLEAETPRLLQAGGESAAAREDVEQLGGACLCP